jgi:hypothetical protein
MEQSTTILNSASPRSILLYLVQYCCTLLHKTSHWSSSSVVHVYNVYINLNVCYSYDLYIEYFRQFVFVYIHCSRKFSIQSQYGSRTIHQRRSDERLFAMRTQVSRLCFFLSVHWPMVQSFWIFFYCLIMVLPMNEEG